VISLTIYAESSAVVRREQIIGTRSWDELCGRNWRTGLTRCSSSISTSISAESVTPTGNPHRQSAHGWMASGTSSGNLFGNYARVSCRRLRRAVRWHTKLYVKQF
jgi:hypothetical protein